MDNELLDAFESLLKTYKKPEKIHKIVQTYWRLNGENADGLNFLTGCYYGSSLQLYESFATNEKVNENEFYRLVKNHLEELVNSFKQILAET